MILIKQKPTYIRTKDGKIIKILKEGIDEFGKYGMVDEENCIRNYDDLKQADIIEELCDEFVFHDIEIGMFTIYPILLPLQKRSKINVDYEQFGAIWVIDENGIPTLKPVAKMNDKGELELL